MSVYVDPLMNCLMNKNWRWPQACHLFADTLDELHLFASRIGLKKSWFQDKPGFGHYDLTPAKRRQAIAAGAVELDRKQTMAWKRRQK